MKFYIPEIGDRIVLTQDWTFDLYYESRNSKLIEFFKLDPYFDKIREDRHKAFHLAGQRLNADEITAADYDRIHREYYSWHRGSVSHPVTLKAGSILQIDRIYIRKGQDDYSSVTFYLYEPNPGKKSKSRGRFWAKIADVNTIEMEREAE